MNLDIIRIDTSLLAGQNVPTVNARFLHAFLEVGKDFSTWIKEQVDRAKLIENKDFAIFPEKGENSGRPRIQYALTIDAAKHIALMAGTEKGFEVREYFIEAEKKLRAAPAPGPVNLDDPGQVLNLALQLTNKVSALQVDLKAANDRVAELEPVAARYQRFTEAEGAFAITHAAKILQQPPRKFCNWLRTFAVYYSDRHNMLPYQQYLDKGYFTVKARHFGDIGSITVMQTLITPKGMAWLAQRLGAEILQLESVH